MRIANPKATSRELQLAKYPKGFVIWVLSMPTTYIMQSAYILQTIGTWHGECVPAWWWIYYV